MTYWQALRYTARELIQWPIHSSEWEIIVEGLFYLFIAFCRIVALVTLPISAPIFAIFVRRELVKSEIES